MKTVQKQYKNSTKTISFISKFLHEKLKLIHVITSFIFILFITSCNQPIVENGNIEEVEVESRSGCSVTTSLPNCDTKSFTTTIPYQGCIFTYTVTYFECSFGVIMNEPVISWPNPINQKCSAFATLLNNTMNNGTPGERAEIFNGLKRAISIDAQYKIMNSYAGSNKYRCVGSPCIHDQVAPVSFKRQSADCLSLCIDIINGDVYVSEIVCAVSCCWRSQNFCIDPTSGQLCLDDVTTSENNDGCQFIIGSCTSNNSGCSAPCDRL